MATIGVGTGSYIRPHRTVRTETFRVDASQTLAVGEAVILSADSNEGNRIKICGADPTTDRAFVGFAAAAITTGASPTASDAIPVWIADENAQFVVHCEDAAAIDNDDISVLYGIVKDSTNNIWRLDRSETSATVFRVVQLIDAHGDVNGRLVAKVIVAERLY